MEMKEMNNEEFFENALIVSEEGRAIRLYLTYHPSAFLLGGMGMPVTKEEVEAVFDIFGSESELDEDEIIHKIFHGRLERLLMYLEKVGMVKIIERKDGLTELEMDGNIDKYIKKLMGV